MERTERRVVQLPVGLWERIYRLALQRQQPIPVVIVHLLEAGMESR